MSIARRIRQAAAGNAAGVVVSGVLQLISVPALTAAWGVSGYGIWIMLMALPTYVNLTDLGFTQVAVSSITAATATGERDRAVAIYQSVLSLVGLFGGGVALLVGLLAAHGPIEHWLATSLGVPAMAIIVLAGYSAIALVSRMALVAFIATGAHGLGSALFALMLLLEGLAVILVALLGGSQTDCIIALAAVRGLGAALLFLLMHRREPWLRPGVAQARIGVVRELFAPALAALTIPTAIAANLQGTLVVIGATLSTAAAGAFAPVRTMSRLLIQLLASANYATMPELAAAVATGNRQAQARVLAANLLLAILLLVPGALAFALLGRPLIALWTGGRIVPDASLVALIAAGMAIHGLWYFLSTLLIAVQAQGRVAPTVLGAAIFCLLLAIPAARHGGVNGVAAVIILNESICLIRALIAWRALGLVSGAELLSAMGAVVARARSWR